MSTDPNETNILLERIKKKDTSAFEELFRRHRRQLQKVIAMRLDRRVAARVDASDVVQETYLEAFKRIQDYLDNNDMPFYLWLHWIALEKVIGLHRRHLGAQKRAVQHEVPIMQTDNSIKLVSGLCGRIPSPTQELAKAELVEKLRLALGQLSSDERDLILCRNFERLSSRDIALMLNITEAAAKKRYIRALDRLRKILQKQVVTASIEGIKK